MMGITGMYRKYLWNAFKNQLGNIKLNGGGSQFLFVVTLLFQVISEDTLVRILKRNRPRVLGKGHPINIAGFR